MSFLQLSAQLPCFFFETISPRLRLAQLERGNGGLRRFRLTQTETTAKPADHAWIGSRDRERRERFHGVSENRRDRFRKPRRTQKALDKSIGGRSIERMRQHRAQLIDVFVKRSRLLDEAAVSCQ